MMCTLYSEKIKAIAVLELRAYEVYQKNFFSPSQVATYKVQCS